MRAKAIGCENVASPFGARASSGGSLARVALGAIGRALRPYYKLGDDELVIVARRG